MTQEKRLNLLFYMLSGAFLLSLIFNLYIVVKDDALSEREVFKNSINSVVEVNVFWRLP